MAIYRGTLIKNMATYRGTLIDGQNMATYRRRGEHQPHLCDQSHVKTVIIYKRNYYTFTLIFLIKIDLCSKFL